VRPQPAILRRGAYDIEISERLAGLTILKEHRAEPVDEGVGKEMRGYFLDWIKK